jgi:hypothetical protein
MAKKPQISRYQRLVAGFAASAFALLGTLCVQQQEANTVSAELRPQSVVMTNYRGSVERCVQRLARADRATAGNIRNCYRK